MKEEDVLAALGNLADAVSKSLRTATKEPDSLSAYEHHLRVDLCKDPELFKQRFLNGYKVLLKESEAEEPK
jgi:hypothetical protein